MDGCDYFVLARVSTIEFTDFEGIKINAKLYVFNIFIYMVKFQEVAPKTVHCLGLVNDPLVDRQRVLKICPAIFSCLHCDRVDGRNPASPGMFKTL